MLNAPNRRSPPAWLTLAVLLAASVLWGLTWWPLRELAARGLGGMALILVAYGSVGLLLAPLLWHQRRQWRSQWPWLLLVLITGSVANIAFPWSLMYGDVIRSMALFYLLPVWGVLGGRLFLGEPIGRVRLLAMLLALAGAFLLLGGPDILRAPPGWIDFVAILSGFALAMTNLAFRATPELPATSKIAALFLGCLLVSAFMIALTPERFPAVPAATLGWALLFGIGMILVATIGTQWAVTHMEAGKSSIVMVTELVVATLSATLIGGETLTPLEIGGGLLILGATLLEAGASFSSATRTAAA